MSYATFKPRAPATTTTDDGWQTVSSRTQTRDLPSSFQARGPRPTESRGLPSSFQSRGLRDSGDRQLPASFQKDSPAPLEDDRRQSRLSELREVSLRAEHEARERRVAEEEAARKEADALNFLSTQSYPSLGGGSSAATKKPAMNFKKTVQNLVEREERAAALAVTSMGEDADDYFATLSAQPSNSGSRQKPVIPSYDPDEEDESYEENGQESDGEFNSDLHSTRRRGDKGVW